jgi:hypothetical protein
MTFPSFGQLCMVASVDVVTLKVGDIALCRVRDNCEATVEAD